MLLGAQQYAERMRSTAAERAIGEPCPPATLTTEVSRSAAAGCRCRRASRWGCAATAATPRRARAWTSAAASPSPTRSQGCRWTCACGRWWCIRPTVSASAGCRLSFGWDPTPSSPLGLTARVAPSWGGQATGGAEALWSNQMAYGMGSHQMYGSGDRVDAEVGYGLPVGARVVGTPRVGVATSQYGRDYRVGYGLGVLDRGRRELRAGRRRAAPGESDAGRGQQRVPGPGHARLVRRGSRANRGAVRKPAWTVSSTWRTGTTSMTRET